MPSINNERQLERLSACNHTVDTLLKDTSVKLPCGTKFLRVLFFAIFAVFHAIRKNNPVPANEITANIFHGKIYSRVNIL